MKWRIQKFGKGRGSEDNLSAPSSQMRTAKYMLFTRKKRPFAKKNEPMGRGRPSPPPPPLNPPLNVWNTRYEEKAQLIKSDFDCTSERWITVDITNCSRETTLRTSGQQT